MLEILGLWPHVLRAYSWLVPRPLELIGYMRTVARGSPVDRPWSVSGMFVSMIWHGRGLAPKDSPLTLQDVMARTDYRDLMTPKVVEGNLAPDFELPRLGGEGTVRLASLLREQPGPVGLIFGSYS
jgi:hypothetical protein